MVLVAHCALQIETYFNCRMRMRKHLKSQNRKYVWICDRKMNWICDRKMNFYSDDENLNILFLINDKTMAQNCQLEDEER